MSSCTPALSNISVCTDPGTGAGGQADRNVGVLQMNVTSLSANVLSFLLHDKEHSVYLLQEHRLQDKAYYKAISKLARKFYVYSSPAPTKVAGAQAGTMVLIRKHLHIIDKRLFGVHHESAFWSVGIVRFKHRQIAFVSVYLLPCCLLYTSPSPRDRG